MNFATPRKFQVLFPLLVASITGCGSAADIGTKDAAEANPGNPNPVVPVSTEGTIQVQCTTDATRWKAATPTAAHDGFEVRQSRAGSETAVVVATVKPLCSSSKNRTECDLATATRVEGGWDPSGGIDAGPRVATPEFVVTSSGDAVRVIKTVEDLAIALSPIESADEAAILLSLRGYTPKDCGLDGRASVPAARQTGTAFDLTVRTGGSCGAPLKEAVMRVDASGGVTLISETVVKPGGPNACGRRPAGLEPCSAATGAGVGSLLAHMAWLEAASVPAFAALARDLGRHGAPPTILKRVERARKDEIRHARLMRAAARRHGAKPQVPRVARATSRSLYEIALENAVEGCVRETYGAVVATHQAAHAPDRELATLFGSIASDETEHAALSWDLAAWIEPQLSASERESVDLARSRAVTEIYSALETAPSLDEQTRGGMPSSSVGRTLLAALETALFAA